MTFDATVSADEEAARRWDADSAFGGDEDRNEMEMDSMKSLASSVLAYTYENGRRYHAFRAGQYFMPNDEEEQESMDLMHHVSRMILKGELYRAPVDDPQNVLDIGTGTGIWAIDVADRFPGAHVIATDLSPIQPNWVPPNLEFQVDDCESPWCFNRKFDFIHLRNLIGSIADWPRLLQLCHDHLKPGGWIEVANIEAWASSNNNALTPNSASLVFKNNLKEAGSIVGREFDVAPELGRLIRHAGFRDVVHDQHMVPMSPWQPDTTELARYFQHLALMELEALSLRLFTRVLGWSAEQLHSLLTDIVQELKDPAKEMFSIMHYAYGRKPMNAST